MKRMIYMCKFISKDGCIKWDTFTICPNKEIHMNCKLLVTTWDGMNNPLPLPVEIRKYKLRSMIDGSGKHNVLLDCNVDVSYYEYYEV